MVSWQWLAWAVLVGIVLGTLVPEAMERVRDYRKGVRG